MEFWDRVLFLSWQQHYEKEYQKLVSAKTGK